MVATENFERHVVFYMFIYLFITIPTRLRTSFYCGFATKTHNVFSLSPGYDQLHRAPGTGTTSLYRTLSWAGAVVVAYGTYRMDRQ
jgi:hypothetical protein